MIVAIDFSYVLQEQRGICAYLLEDMEIDDIFLKPKSPEPEQKIEMLCYIMHITCTPAGYCLQGLLAQWLLVKVDNSCADWFKTHW